MKLIYTGYSLLLLLAILSVTVLAGWFLNIAPIVQVLPGQAPMQFNTALGLLFSSLATFFLYRGTVSLVGILSFLVLLLSSLTLSQYLFGWDLGIDNFFWEHTLTDKTSHLGRMAPNTAVCFLLSSIVLLSAAYLKAGSAKAATVSFLIATLIGLSANTLIGYLFNLEYTYGWMQWTRMAIHTGFAFILLVSIFTIYSIALDSSFRKLNSFYISAIIVYASLILTLSIGLALRAGEYQSVNSMIENRLESYKLDVRRTMTDRLRAFDRFAGRWDNIIDETEEAERATYQLLKDFPGLDAIAWVRNGGEGVEVYSVDFNESFQQIPREKEIVSLIENIYDNYSYVGVRDTAGWPHAIFAFPVQGAGGGRLGNLVFYWKAADVFRIEGGDIVNAFELTAICDNQEIFSYALSNKKDQSKTSWVRDTSINIDGMEIFLKFQPFESTIKQWYSGSSDLIFATGVLLSLLLGSSAYYYSRSISKAQEAITARSESELLANRLKSATEGADIGIWEYLPQTESIVHNEIAAKLASIDSNQLETPLEVWLQSIQYEDAIEFKRVLSECSQPDDTFRIVCKAVPPDNTVKYLQIVASRFEHPHPTLSGIVYDITDEIEQQARDRALNAELIRSNKELEDFARIASHDLQEPLRKIRAFGERLGVRIKDSDPKSKDYLDRMTSAATRMSQLVQDLLNFSRVSTRAKPFELIDLNKILQHALDNLETSIETSAAAIEADTLPSIYADPMQLTQLFQNLIGNSLKYARSGVAPVVRVEVAETANKYGISEYLITFTDNGIGFEQKYAEQVFEVFRRLHGLGEYAGTGVGLSICKKIIERHQGEIWAKSSPGNGAQFFVKISQKINKTQG